MSRYWLVDYLIGVACAVAAAVLHAPGLEIVAGFWLAAGIVWLAVRRAGR